MHAKIVSFAILAWLMTADACVWHHNHCQHAKLANTTVYSFSLYDVHKKELISLCRFRGLVLLVLNVASFCGSTPQYHGLNALKEKYAGKGFEILGFPCNLFGKKEPGANGTEILNSLKHVRPGSGFVPNFPLFEKIEVNGKEEHPFYTYLKEYCPPTTDLFFQEGSGIYYKPLRNGDVRWNFEKFLINRAGYPVDRIFFRVNPMGIMAEIEMLLQDPIPEVP